MGEDTNRVNTLNVLAREHELKGMLVEGKQYAVTAKNLAYKLRFDRGLATALANLGNLNYQEGNYKEALTQHFASYEINERINNKPALIRSLSNIGLVYSKQSEYPKALEHMFKALKMAESSGNKIAVAQNCSNIGLVYESQKKYKEALEYTFRALKIAEELGNKNGTAICLGNIGNSYTGMKNYEKSLEYHLKAQKIDEEIGNNNGVARHLANIAIVYTDQKNYTEALEFLQRAEKIYAEVGNKAGSTNCAGNIGNLFYRTGKFKEAEIYLNKAVQMGQSLGAKEYVRDNERTLARLYDTTGRHKEAFVHYKNYIGARDSIDNEEKEKKQLHLEAKLEYEKKEAILKAGQEKKETQAKASARIKNLIISSTLLGFLLVAGFAINTIRKNKIIANEKHKVEEAHQLISVQKTMVEEKNKAIIDSINYAKRIQNAILPNSNEFKQVFNESFVFYKPKDIVAGDFYWLEETENYIFLAVADCTGHGVPGAMVSVICSTALTKAVLEDRKTETNEILDRTRDIVLEKLSKSEENIKDGMDVCLLRINKNPADEIQYSGANRSLIKINSSGLTEYKPDKQPIGNYDHKKPFTKQIIKAGRGDNFYLQTDGYYDQFGGTKQKKLTSKKMKELLLSLAGSEMETQGKKLESFFKEWQGSAEQIDDVCIIGVKI